MDMSILPVLFRKPFGEFQWCCLHKKFPFLLYCAALFFLLTASSRADGYEETPMLVKILPGGTHLYEGDTKEGAAFLGLDLLLGAAAVGVHGRLEHNGKDEWNIPLILAGQVYAADKWRYYQKIRSRYSPPGQNRGVKYDPTPLTGLLRSPFETKNITSPLVIACALFGIVDGIVAYPRHTKHFGDISSVEAVGNRLNRTSGTLYYETSSAALSYGAAVSEEMLYRGILLPVLDQRYGKRAGLFASSVIFGALHLTNPDIERPVYFVSQATLAGFLFGWIVQRNGYLLSESIAGHFWYDFVSLTTTWLLNPKENPIGLSVGFRY
jgi:membrane protease YdiL (CAAX protease family)